jgi:bifunctional aspartokinase / homoserine dehydrogenase 1
VNTFKHVHKFGGSSLATPAAMLTASHLVPRSTAVVVSAIGGVTSQLQALLDWAMHTQDFDDLLNNVINKHRIFVEELFDAKQARAVWNGLQEGFDAIQAVLASVAVVHTYSNAERAEVLGLGERSAALIFSALLSQDRSSHWLDASQVLYVLCERGVEGFDWEKSRTALDGFLIDKACDALVITGFLAADGSGCKTLLERNGSDVSASAFAQIMEADDLVIWTDTSGIYSADPRYVDSAFPLPELSYEEALELAYFGASVIHPKAIAPAQKARRPIFIKNTFDPHNPGSRISENPNACAHAVRGLTSINDVALLTVEGAGLLGVSGVAARAFSSMHHEKISVILISQASSEHSICFCVQETEGLRAKKALEECFAYELSKGDVNAVLLENDVSIVAAVGEGMVGTLGISGRLCDTLAKAQVNIRAIAQGASERNISTLVNSADVPRALKALHAGFYLAEKTINIAMVGVGLVGSELLAQMTARISALYEDDNIHLRVCAIMNSRHLLTDACGIHLPSWKDALDDCKKPADMNALIQFMSSNEFPHTVLVDCTANESVASRYLDVMKAGMHVITPNKRAGSGEGAYYQALHHFAKKEQRHFLYETTVCAGLPVIGTLQDILRTGDRVDKIEGVVSGSLSYIFFALASGARFSEAVFQAKEKGFTEPDPRDDLSGRDVGRKMVCLARELGLQIEMDDVVCVDLVPAELASCSLDAFLEKLPAYDAAMEQQLAAIKKDAACLAYAGNIDQNGQVTVGLNAYSNTHPFSHLNGTDNMLVFTTARYHEQPLIIRGPGAGAAVTAAGVFADVLRLVSLMA